MKDLKPAKSLSIIVPTLNEADNIAVLVRRIAASLKDSGIRYEIVFVDDHSTDRTADEINKLSKTYPLSLHLKHGPRGKAFSLLQGFEIARYDTLCMIDADLQYPPEAIAPMYELMTANGVDVVLTKRNYAGVSKIRQFITAGFNLVFTRFLFGFNYDTQSGLKLFRKVVADKADLRPTPWSFDLEFIVRALENKFKILSYTIPFSERLSGEAKVRIVKVAFELAKASVRLKLNSSPRRIRNGYRMNLKLAEQAIGLFIVGVVGVASIAASFTPRQTQAQVISLPQATISLGTTATQTRQPDLPAGLLPTMPLLRNTPLQPASSTTQPVDNGSMLGSSQTGGQGIVMSAAASPSTSASTSAANNTYRLQSTAATADGADTTTYALRPTGQPFAYPEAAGQVIEPARRGLLTAVAAAAVLATSYLLISANRNRFGKLKLQEEKS